MTDICSFDELADGTASQFTVDGTDFCAVHRPLSAPEIFTKCIFI